MSGQRVTLRRKTTDPDVSVPPAAIWWPFPLGAAACQAALLSEQREVDMTSGFRSTDPGDAIREADEASLRLEPEDVLEDDQTGDDVLDVGYAPQDRPWAVDDWGTTAEEEETGESLDGRLAREVPEDSDDPDDD